VSRACDRAGVGFTLLCALAVLLASPVASPAWAHTTLVSSTPADGAQVDIALTTIELVFSEPVDPRLVTVVVSSADGGEWQDGAPAVTEAVVTQAVRPLTGGGYSVAYRVVSADGHPVTGELKFAVAATPPTTVAAASPTDVPISTPAARSRPANEAASGTSIWTYAAIGLPVVALLFAGGMALARAGTRGGRRGHGG
jgi:copper resistance protein C